MAKNVFRPVEIYNMYENKVALAPPPAVHEVEEEQELEVYSGPTVEDLQQEAEAFRLQWERERADLISRANAEAEKIRKEAEDEAFRRLKEKSDQADRYQVNKEEEASQLVTDAEAKARQLIEDAEARVASIEKEAYSRGYDTGKEEGFQEGTRELQRLLDRLHVIINTVIDKRKEIIEDAETQVIDLVLLISRKVVKVISENQRNVVINNVVQALRKLKSRGDVAIRVNLSDLDLTTEHIKDFMKMVENVKSITVLEDSTVEKGGCIIETDFGEIDARISSQLREIEEKVLELMPVKAKGES